MPYSFLWSIYNYTWFNLLLARYRPSPPPKPLAFHIPTVIILNRYSRLLESLGIILRGLCMIVGLMTHPRLLLSRTLTSFDLPISRKWRMLLESSEVNFGTRRILMLLLLSKEVSDSYKVLVFWRGVQCCWGPVYWSVAGYGLSSRVGAMPPIPMVVDYLDAVFVSQTAICASNLKKIVLYASASIQTPLNRLQLWLSCYTRCNIHKIILSLWVWAINTGQKVSLRILGGLSANLQHVLALFFDNFGNIQRRRTQKTFVRLPLLFPILYPSRCIFHRSMLLFCNHFFDNILNNII